MSRRSSLWCAAILLIVFNPAPAHAEAITLIENAEYQSGYERSLFKHWVDADRNGCDTRKEVLIAEAIIKPTVGAKCALTGGAWYSDYDGKTITNASSLDIDHLVPLAEAWRSGAWAWTPEQREAYANDLTEPRALIAVSASTNRAKGDSDPKDWLPEQGRCTYIESWVTVKLRYALTIDSGELSVIKGFFNECRNLQISTVTLPGFAVTLNPAQQNYKSVTLTIVGETSPSVAPAAIKEVRLYGRCSVLGAKGRSAEGRTYTCKQTKTDATKKWRP